MVMFCYIDFRISPIVKLFRFIIEWNVIFIEPKLTTCWIKNIKIKHNFWLTTTKIIILWLPWHDPWQPCVIIWTVKILFFGILVLMWKNRHKGKISCITRGIIWKLRWNSIFHTSFETWVSVPVVRSQNKPSFHLPNTHTQTHCELILIWQFLHKI